MRMTMVYAEMRKLRSGMHRRTYSFIGAALAYHRWRLERRRHRWLGRRHWQCCGWRRRWS
jgi:hypothetical protein